MTDDLEMMCKEVALAYLTLVTISSILGGYLMLGMLHSVII